MFESNHISENHVLTIRLPILRGFQCPRSTEGLRCRLSCGQGASRSVRRHDGVDVFLAAALLSGSRKSGGQSGSR